MLEEDGPNVCVGDLGRLTVNDVSPPPHQCGTTRRKKVTVAHSSEDSDKAQQLKDFLTTESIDCWIYDEIPPGKSIFSAIQESMQVSQLNIIIVIQLSTQLGKNPDKNSPKRAKNWGITCYPPI